MSRKTTEAYTHLFTYIRDNILDMQCHSITTDFELAMRNALFSLYPNVKYRLCWFHFTQAAKKRAMQTAQFYPYIRKNREAEMIYYKLLSLPLLPAHLILAEFSKLKVIARARHRAIFTDFLAYYENQWLKKVSESVI